MSFDLNELFKSLHSAVDEATDVSRCSVNRWINQFFDIDSDGKHTPKYAKMVIPVVKDGKLTEENVNVPLYTLANHQSIKLDHLELDFCVNLEQIKKDKTVAKLFPMIKMSDNRAKIKMIFKGSTPAEGIMKINDTLIKTIPS
jgi:hypothetical protein